MRKKNTVSMSSNFVSFKQTEKGLLLSLSTPRNDSIFLIYINREIILKNINAL